MALMRDEGGSDFLSKGAYPKAAERACEAMLRYMSAQGEFEKARWDRALESQRGGAQTYEHYAYSVMNEHDMCRALSQHPMEHAALERLNWSHERPRVDVQVSTEERRSTGVSVMVSPAVETMTYEGVSHAWWGGVGVISRSSDFQTVFRGSSWDQQTGSIRVLDIRLDDQALREYGHREKGVDGLDATRWQAGREAVFHAVQHKLHQLSMVFNCRVQSRLVMYGPERMLEWRRGTPQDWLEREGRYSEGHKAKPSVLDGSGWHGERITGFLKKNPGCEGWLRQFVQARRVIRTIEQLQQELAEYMEVPRHQVEVEVVEELVAATDDAYFAKEARRRMEDPQVLKTFIDERGPYGKAWLDRAVDLTRTKKHELLMWLLENHPKVMCVEGVKHLDAKYVFEIVREMERPWSAKEIDMGAKAHTTLDKMLATVAMRGLPAHNLKGVKTEQKPLSKANQQWLTRLAGRSSWEDLMAWAQASWPALASELGQLKIDKGEGKDEKKPQNAASQSRRGGAR